MMKWDTYFINMAMLVAKKSKDPSTQVGCVIVGPDKEIRSTGFNGFPRGVEETALLNEHIPMVLDKRPARVKCKNCQEEIPVTQEDFDKYMFTTDYLKCSDHFQVGEVGLIPERWERPAKYEWVEHAERNAVYNAARTGISLKGCTAYLSWEPHPCVECTKAFIQAGITEVVGPDIPFPSSGKDWKFDTSRVMMDEADVWYRSVKWGSSLVGDQEDVSSDSTGT